MDDICRGAGIAGLQLFCRRQKGGCKSPTLFVLMQHDGNRTRICRHVLRCHRDKQDVLFIPVMTAIRKSGHELSRVDKNIRIDLLAVDELIGFVVGEIRAWEFGSPPCGWVLALSVSPQHRERGIGALLLEALSAGLKTAGIATIRTMVLGSDQVNLSFFAAKDLLQGLTLNSKNDWTEP